MRKSVVLVGAMLVASAAVGGVPAKAADLYGGSIKDEPVYAPPAFSWTGMYFGGHAGYEWGKLDGSDLLGLVPTSLNADGWLGGIQLGYNYQFGRNIVAGTEISGSWGNGDGSGNCYGKFFDPLPSDNNKLSCNGGHDWTVQWLNKMGVAFGADNRMLAYAIGGVAITDLSFSRKFSYDVYDGDVYDGRATVRSGGSQTTVGVVLGAGFQYAFTNNWSLGVEWLHTEYASADIQGGITRSCKDGTCGGGTGTLTKAGPTAHEQLGTDTVRAVFNFKFN